MTLQAPDVRKIREQLYARRAALLTRYHDANDRAEEELATPPREMVETASEQWDARTLSELSDVDARALENVVAAIQRLEAGSYGRCAVCSQPIEPARLRLLPEVADCAECARFAEETPPRSIISSGEER